jgi:hypothetical protein
MAAVAASLAAHNPRVGLPFPRTNRSGQRIRNDQFRVRFAVRLPCAQPTGIVSIAGAGREDGLAESGVTAPSYSMQRVLRGVGWFYVLEEGNPCSTKD